MLQIMCHIGDGMLKLAEKFSKVLLNNLTFLIMAKISLSIGLIYFS